jgi:hypothetical protein
MQRANKPTTPAGLALAFMSLTILPFSLNALGVRTDFSLAAALGGLKQLSSALTSAYEPVGSPVYTLPGSLPEPVRPRQSENECPKMLAELAIGPEGYLVERMVPQTQTDLFRSACNEEKAAPEPQPEPEACSKARIEEKAEQRSTPARSHKLLARDARAKAQLPIRSLALGDLLEMAPVSPDLVDVSKFVIEVKALARARNELRRAYVKGAVRVNGDSKDFKELQQWMQFEFKTAPGGQKLPCPPPPVNVRRV